MTKSLHTILKVLLFAIITSMPVVMHAEEFFRSQIETEQNQIHIAINESNLRVKNAEGMTIEIFSITGEKVYTQKIESQSKSIDMSSFQRGYYIVKVGKYTRKIYLR
ncbi:MAG: T9SS type A sorting domain-containing protein [Bacteroidaceae bacterium]|nr:T9SS type A sorting domain-containing protein [Bacteroidaceae bacterium]